MTLPEIIVDHVNTSMVTGHVAIIMWLHGLNADKSNDTGLDQDSFRVEMHLFPQRKIQYYYSNCKQSVDFRCRSQWNKTYLKEAPAEAITFEIYWHFLHSNLVPVDVNK